MAIKKHDYVEVNYTGKIKGDNIVFDTTEATVAKQHNFYDAKVKYAPVIVCIGKRHLIKGLDEQLIGKEPGKYTFEVRDVDGFGKKDPKLLRLIPMSLFSKEQVKPFPGLEVNIDNQFGVVKSVSGGRVIVDFNHPLSSKDLAYDIEVKRIIEDAKEKVKGLLDIIKFPYTDVTVEGDAVTIMTPMDIPQEITDGLIKDIVETVGVKTVEFKTEKKEEEKKKEEKTEKKETPEETTEKKETETKDSEKEVVVNEKIEQPEHEPHTHEHNHSHEHGHDHNHNHSHEHDGEHDPSQDHATDKKN
ncbi:MAG: FKBP-type peptidyl-prolyl cis-trans isomerase [Nanoarchaeota archaeon]